MRLAGVAAALALLAVAPAGAQPAAPLALAPTEILLEVDATGVTRTPADLARVMVVATSKADSAAHARAANAVQLERLTAAARSAGVAAGDIRPGANPWSRYGFIGNEAIDAGPAVMAPPPGRSETAFLEIKLRDLARFDALRAALEDAGANQVSGPFYMLEDASAAERAAKRQAIVRAREQAEDYARSLGMRVVRILRVSERTAPRMSIDNAVEATFLAMYGPPDAASGEVETRVTVAMDFALAPAR